METLIQKASRIAETESAYEQGKRGPFEGLVVSIASTTDTMGISFGPAKERRMPIQHPFSGTTSWIRSVPEVNTRFLMQNRMDTGQPEALKTLPPPASKRSSDYLNQLNVYRLLTPGEHDIASSGMGLAYFGHRGHVDLRSGHAIKRSLNRETLTVEDSAPTHIRNLLYHTVGTMGDEERLGIVKRWKNAVDHNYIQDSNNKFQAERYIKVKNPAGSNPSVLFRKIEGQVYEDDGTLLKQASTSIPLRHQSLWYTTTDEFLRLEIDQNGNQVIQYPSTATIGYEMIIPNGNYRGEMVNRDMTIKGDEQVVVKGNVLYRVQGSVQYNVTKKINLVVGENDFTMGDSTGVSVTGIKGSNLNLDPSGNINIQDSDAGGASFAGNSVSMFNSSGTKVSMSSTNMNLDAEMLYLGKNAGFPAVIGLTMLSWLDNHNHLAMGTPTSPPIVPANSLTGTPISLVSASVFVPPNI